MRLSSVLNSEKDLVSLNSDATFSSFVEQSNALGKLLGIGDMTAAFFDKNGAAGGTYLVPVDDGSCIEFKIGVKCSPDRIIKSLTE